MSKEKYQKIRIHSPDSDIFFILLKYVHKMDETTLMFDTGNGNKRHLINIKDIARSYSEQSRSSLLGLHTFCGCDTTSAFKGKGHVGPNKLLKKYPRYMRPLARFGNEWDVSKSLWDELEEFTCAMYGDVWRKQILLCRITKSTNSSKSVKIKQEMPLKILILHCCLLVRRLLSSTSKE